jgi:hypothetical protein
LDYVTPDPDALGLIEGRDYVVEDGRWVFLPAYHLKRGHCCASGCRHCPYRAGDGAEDARGGSENADDGVGPACES